MGFRSACGARRRASTRSQTLSLQESMRFPACFRIRPSPRIGSRDGRTRLKRSPFSLQSRGSREARACLDDSFVTQVITDLIRLRVQKVHKVSERAELPENQL